MEVQRGTLAQLKAMQSSMQGPAEDAGHQAGALWANLQNQFNQMVAAAQASTASDSKASTAAAKPAKATKARAGETSRAKKTSSSRASGSAKTPRPRSGPTGSSPP
jgi:hypothetical protein